MCRTHLFEVWKLCGDLVLVASLFVGRSVGKEMCVVVIRCSNRECRPSFGGQSGVFL